MTYYVMIGRVAATAAALLIAAPSMAAVSYGDGTVALGTTTSTEDFDTLASTGMTGTALPSGWFAYEDGANANNSYGVSTGSDTGGNIYSYGSANSTDRALGTLRSGSLIPMIGAVFTNATQSTITDLAFSYTGEQWRNGSASVDSLIFQYMLGASDIGTPTSTGWTSIDSLSFSSPSNATVGALNGNLNSAALAGSLSGLSIAAGSTFAIRFLDADPTGADDGLAVDNFSVTATTAAGTPAPVPAVPEPATWAMMVFGFGLIGATMRRRRTSVAFA